MPHLGQIGLQWIVAAIGFGMNQNQNYVMTIGFSDRMKFAGHPKDWFDTLESRT